MNTENYSRRRFVRHSLTLAGVTFAWSAFRSNSLARQAETGQPASPDEALAELLVGNKRYVTGQNIHHDFGPERAALAQSQHPFAIILGCADSRVAPELAFDQTRGRLFVVRLAGNFVDDNGLASIEFGAAVLGAFLIMILGHNECGALKAAVDVVTKKRAASGTPARARRSPESAS
jgi:carbonic anhydrase